MKDVVNGTKEDRMKDTEKDMIKDAMKDAMKDTMENGMKDNMRNYRGMGNDGSLWGSPDPYGEDYSDDPGLVYAGPVYRRPREEKSTQEEAPVVAADPGEYNVTFDDIYGYEPIKKLMTKLVYMAKHPEDLAKVGSRMPRGILLHGIPGVGKTMMAKALIHEMGRTAYILRKTEGGNAFIKTIGNVFKEAAANEPSVVLFDDMDRFSSGAGYTPEFTAIQAGIDSVSDRDVFVIATVNDMDRFPDSLCRKGRFDYTITVSVPEISESPQIISRFLKDKVLAPDINLVTVARLLDGYTCADLASVLNEAGLNAACAGRDIIGMEDLVSAILTGVFELDAITTISDTDRTETAYHEAGHAAVAMLRNPGSVTIASICSGAGTTKGFVETMREEPSYDYFISQIMCSLAGRAALELKFGHKDIGCADDVSKAVKKITRLVNDCCVSGLKFAYLGRGMDSDESMRNKNTETVRILEDCYSETKTLLTLNWDLVERIAHGLIERDTLICDDLDAIMAEYEAEKRGVPAGSMTAGNMTAGKMAESSTPVNTTQANSTPVNPTQAKGAANCASANDLPAGTAPASGMPATDSISRGWKAA